MFSSIVGYKLRNGLPINAGNLTEEDFSIDSLRKSKYISWNHVTSVFFPRSNFEGVEEEECCVSP